MFDSTINDTRFAVRLLRKSPLFTVTAALSLAIGIGANTTIFSAGSALLLRPLPGLLRSDRLVDVGRQDRGEGFDTVSYPTYTDVRDRATSFTGLYAHQLEPTPISLGIDGEPERVYGSLVSANYFAVLGTSAHAGRLLRAEDDRGIGANPVVVIGYDLWVRRFAADPATVGRQVRINGSPFMVVGITPRGFQGTTLIRGDLWVPLSMMSEAMPDRNADLFTSRGATWLFMGGRLRDGVTVKQANAELASIATALEREHPAANRQLRLGAAPIAVIPGLARMVAAFVALLMGIVTLLLLIACVNLAGMLLARGAARSREVAVRLALGAGPGRIIRQLLTETVVLFAVGGVAGLLLSRWLSALLLAVLPQLPIPLHIDITTDWRVVSFTIVISAVAAVLCGLAPALQARRTSVVSALKADAAGRPERLRLRNAFVVAQVTLSLVLVVVAGLFLRALDTAATAPVGFDVRNVDVVALDLSLARLTPDAGRAFTRELLERARALPSVQAASTAADLPLDGGRMGFGSLRVPGARSERKDGEFPAYWNIVEPGFFQTLRLPLVRGRDFAGTDTSASQRVAIVNEAFARAAWPGLDPIGREVESDAYGSMQRMTVVGIAADARTMAVGEPAEPYIYVPLQQLYTNRINVLVKHGGASMIPELRALVRSLNMNLPVSEAVPLEQITAVGTIPQRIAAAIAGTLGIVGLLLATMGIYGVTSYSVNQRIREIGIRVALGAEHRDVMRLLLRQGATLAGIGVVAGLVAAAAGAQLIGSMLYGVRALDPITFGTAAALFSVVALTATYVPARRALSIDPMRALRNE